MKKTRIAFIFFVTLIFSSVSFFAGQEEQPQKIAIASDGDTIESQVGSQGARCAWFLFFDEKGQLTEAVENPYRQESGGAGIGSAGFLAEKGVTLFVAGNVGNKMGSALESNGITFISFSGTVQDALKEALERIRGKH